MDPGQPGFIELALNYSTDLWSLEGQPPGDSMPPLPGVPEEPYIGRVTLFMSDVFEGHYVVDYVLPDYNPEWVSIDVRGFNFDIPMGLIVHACTGVESMDLSFVITSGECCIPPIRGNVNYDPGDNVNIADLTYLVAYLFGGGPPPPCFEEGDVNGDGAINIADLTYLVAYLFRGGPPPAPCP